ncbi:MAG: SPOR domain-containing protein [Nitrospinaceae bacterium]
MLKTKQQKTSSVEENNQPLEEINKYHKQFGALIEDAEVEEEIETGENFRSKNSRMFTISMIGIGLLGLVYFQINHQNPLPELEPEASVKIPKTDEQKLAKRVPVLENGSTASNLPVPSSTIAKPPKSKNFIPSSGAGEIKQPANEKNVSPTLKPKLIARKIPPAILNKNSRFFVQVGAFGVKVNAESLFKKLKTKGFFPSIELQSQSLNQHIVTVGGFANTKSGNNKLNELMKKGFKASYLKTSDNSYSLKVGQFKNFKDAESLQDQLSLKGFLSESHKANAPANTYIVQLGVFPNKEKALLAQEELARTGYSKTFLR